MEQPVSPAPNNNSSQKPTFQAEKPPAQSATAANQLNPVEDPGLAAEVTSRKRKFLLPLIIIVVFLLIGAGAAAGYYAYTKLARVSPLELMPTDTIAVISVANISKPEPNPWTQLELHLRQFPILAEYNLKENFAESFLYPNEGGEEGFVDPSRDIFIGITKAPDIKSGISDLATSLTRFSAHLLALNNPSTESAVDGKVAGATSSARETGFLFFVPKVGSEDVREHIQNLRKGKELDMQKLDEYSNVYVLKNEKGSGISSQLFVTSQNGYYIFANQKEDIIRLAEKTLYQRLVSQEKTFADTRAGQSFGSHKNNGDRLLGYAMNLRSEFFSDLQDASQGQIKSTDLPDYLTGQIAIKPEGIINKSVTSTLPDEPKAKPVSNNEKLLARLPEKILGQWVSLYTESAVSADAVRQFCEGNINSDIDCDAPLAGFTLKQLVNLFASADQLAFLLAPRYDGQSPHTAIVLSSASNPEILQQKASAILSGFAEYLNRGFTSLNSNMPSYPPSGTSGQSSPTYRKMPRARQIAEVTTTEYRGRAISDLKVDYGGTKLTVSTVLVDNRLTISSSPAIARQMVEERNSNPPSTKLVQNEIFSTTLQKHPDPSISFSYFYPRGVTGILTWLQNTYLSPARLQGVGQAPNKNNLSTSIDLIDTHLKVVRTTSNSITTTDNEIHHRVYLEIVPLPEAEKEQAIQTLKSMGIKLKR